MVEATKRSGETKFQDCIIAARIPIFVFWIVATCALAYFGIEYSEKTNMYFAAPDNSISYDGQIIVNDTYPGLIKKEKFVVQIIDRSGKYSKEGPFLADCLGEAPTYTAI